MRIAAAVTALFGAIACTASGDLVVFDNSAFVFHWEPLADPDPPPPPEHFYLDITSAPEDQGAGITLHGIYIEFDYSCCQPHWNQKFMRTPSQAKLSLAPVEVFYDKEGYPLEVQFARAYTSGEAVGPEADWGESAWMFLQNSYAIPPVLESFPEHHFVGVEITLGSHTHYGWIEIIWPTYINNSPQPVRWSYETEPDVPALIPAPGDFNGDDVINAFDLLDLLSQWGACAACPADLNDDALVDVFDLLILLANWG